MVAFLVSLQSFVLHRRFSMAERGATAVEYALMVGLIAVGIIASVAILRNKVVATFNTVGNTLA